MSELLFCHAPIAALPYYIEGLGINIYSMEELCYFIAGNVFLLDDSFMNEELCTWIEKQMGAYKLAENLRNVMHAGRRLSVFVGLILEDTCYYSKPEIDNIVSTLEQLEQKTGFECSKMRADQLMEKEKYLAAIYAYRKLLESKDAKEADALLRGNVWHNLGTAYARLFLFGEAAACYEKAYEQNQTYESVREALLCYCYMEDEEKLKQKCTQYFVDENAIEALKEEREQAGENARIQEFDERLEQIRSMFADGQKVQAKDALNDIIFNWKEEYRRGCKV